MVKIDKGIGGPDLLLQLFTSDDLPRTLQENLENLEWLLLKFDLGALFAQFAGLEIQRKYPEANRPMGWVEIRHIREAPQALAEILALAVRLEPAFRWNRERPRSKTGETHGIYSAP